MRTRSRSLAVGALAAVAALVLSACGGGAPVEGGGLAAAGDQPPGVNDVNAVARDQVRDGGDLRWPLDAVPDTFNRNHLDGTLQENKEVMDALMPRAFVARADGTVALNEDYFTSIELTSQSPQVVTYTIHPDATWSDGTPITWTDLRAQWQALNGTDPAFLAATTTGYEDVSAVERGVDDKQAVVTFGTTFAEWRSLFDMIYPASTNTDPAVFEEGWRQRIPVTAGPFRVGAIDTVGRTITLERDPAWWGEAAKLDRIVFRVVERAALADALANGEIDFYEIGSSVDLFSRAQAIPGVEVRQAAAPAYNHITFNGGEGAILADPALRRAVAGGIDRQVISDALVGRIVPEVTPLDSFLYTQGSAAYRDDAGIAFDPPASEAALDRLGWVRPAEGRTREKDGQPLSLRFVTTAGNPISEQIGLLTQAQLAAIGVAVELVPAAPSDFFDRFVTPGDFDMTGFGWSGTPFPISATRNVYTTGGDQNYGGIGSPEIDALYAEALAELDDAARSALGARIDELIWEAVPQLPLHPGTGAYAVTATIANLGAAGNADLRYADIGFTG